MVLKGESRKNLSCKIKSYFPAVLKRSSTRLSPAFDVTNFPFWLFMCYDETAAEIPTTSHFSFYDPFVLGSVIEKP